MHILLGQLQKTLVKFIGQAIMLFANRVYTKHQDIHDQESLRKSGYPNSALQSPIEILRGQGPIFIKSKSFKTQQKIKYFFAIGLN